MIYLLGGGRGFSNTLAASLKRDIATSDSIVFVPSSIEDEVISKLYADDILMKFNQIGINYECSILLGRSSSLASVRESIRKADLVYMMGGDPIEQMEFIKDKNLKPLLMDYDKILIGSSSGAMTLSKYGLINELGVEARVYEGLDLAAGISIEPHYEEAESSLIEKIQKKYGIKKVYGIPEMSAIKILDGNLSFIGEDPVRLLLEGAPPMEIRDLITED